MKLRERDLAVLELLGEESRTPDELASELPAAPGEIDDRLAALADNSLVERRADGAAVRTESGRRVLFASPAGTDDDAIDTPPSVERTVGELDLTPDEADAVRSAYALVRYWGDVTREEIRDAVYSEAPAGYDDADGWWARVRPALAALPSVDPPDGEGEPWRYDGVPESDHPGVDGRRAFDPAAEGTYGSARHALASLDRSGAERSAVRATFGHLVAHGEATERELRDRVYADHAAGYDDAEEWWDDCVRPALERIPGVDRAGGTWRYRQSGE